MMPGQREELCDAITRFISNGGGTFRKFLEYTGIDYQTAYLEGWMNFTNALFNYGEGHVESGITQVPRAQDAQGPTHPMDVHPRHD